MTSTEVVRQTPQQKTLAKLITDMTPELAKALPKHVTPERMARIAVTVVRATPKLAECSPASFLGALLTASQLGLEPGPTGEAYFVPYKQTCTFIPGYRGLIKLARQSGQVSDIYAEIVYANDKFTVTRGLQRNIEHEEAADRNNRGKPTDVYAVAKFKDGTTTFVTMTVNEVEAIRKRSMAANNGPWVTDWEAMAKKGLALDTPIPTPNGWTTMGDIAVGDQVYDMHGAPTRVMAVSEVKDLPCYQVTFSNGEEITCDNEHIWVARVGRNGARDGWKSCTIGELREAKLAGRNVVVPVAKPLSAEVEKLPIDPWLLGYWLGNGDRNSSRITCNGADVDAVTEKIAATTYTPGAVHRDPRSNAVNIGVTDGFLIDLRENGILGTKRIPDEYRRAADWQRRDLLAGLVDSDGHVCKDRGRVHFASTDEYLSDLVAELASSLGEVVHRRTVESRGYGKVVTSYEVHWKPSQCPADLPRKAANYRARKVAAYRAVKSIEVVDSVPTRCIAVESETRTYLAGRTMVPTHNTAVRQLSKWLPLSAEFNSAVALDGTARTDVGPLVDAQTEFIEGEVVQSGRPEIAAPADEVPSGSAEPEVVDGEAAEVVLASKDQLARLAAIQKAEKYNDADWLAYLTDTAGVTATRVTEITAVEAEAVIALFDGPI